MAIDIAEIRSASFIPRLKGKGMNSMEILLLISVEEFLMVLLRDLYSFSDQFYAWNLKSSHENML